MTSAVGAGAAVSSSMSSSSSSWKAGWPNVARLAGAKLAAAADVAGASEGAEGVSFSQSSSSVMSDSPIFSTADCGTLAAAGLDALSLFAAALLVGPDSARLCTQGGNEA